MYKLITDRGTDREETLWEGNNLTVGLQKLNKERAASDADDFLVIELLRVKDNGELQAERIFRFKE